MIALISTSALQVVLSGAVTTNELSVVVSSRNQKAADQGQALMANAPGLTVTRTTGATAVTVKSAPATNSTEIIDSISIYNRDTVPATVTVQILIGSTVDIIRKRTLAAGESMVYENGKGWDDSAIITGNESISGNLSVSGNVAVTGTQTNTGALSTGATGAITAFATGGQASATQLTSDNNRIATCATDGDSVKLPAATAGRRIFVKNAGAASCDVFPSTGEFIDAALVNVAYALPTVKSAWFVCITAGTWETCLTA